MTKPEDLDDMRMEGQEVAEGMEEYVGEGTYDHTQDASEEHEDEGEVDSHGPNGREGSTARHSFNAVRNGYHGNHMDISMED